MTSQDAGSLAPRRLYRRKTHCYMGHEYTPENTRILNDRGHKACKQCRRDREFLRRSPK